MQSGSDNVIGLTNGMVDPGETISATNPRGLLSGGSSPDTGTWSVDMGGDIAAQSAHEFGHLLGAFDSGDNSDLMDSGIWQLASGGQLHATQNDYNQVLAFGVRSAQMNYGFSAPIQNVAAPSNPEININAVWRALTH